MSFRNRVLTLFVLAGLAACTATIAPDWVRWYGHGTAAESRTHWVGGMAEDSYGNLVIVSSTIGSLESHIFDALVVKYTANGERLWARDFDLATQGERSDERPHAVKVGADDAIYVGGQSYRVVDGLGKPVAFLMKLSPDGSLLWKHYLTENEDVRDILLRNGQLVVTGKTTQVFGRDGQRQQLIRHDGFRGWALAEDAQGDMLVAGSQQLAKFDAAGALVWKRPLNSGYSHQASLAVSPNGEISVASAQSGTGSAVVERFTPEGQSLWVRTFAPVSKSNGLPGPALIAEDGRGDLYLAASHIDDRRLVKLSASGRIYWNTTRGSGIVQEIAPTDTGGLLVVGGGHNEKLDADGKVMGESQVQQYVQETTGELLRQGDKLFVAYSARDEDSFKIHLSRYTDQ
ncbi:PQQ-binding-like beta-propeller repeat protein [Marinobacteraceae bacterium S3BR75-40.1]